LITVIAGEDNTLKRGILRLWEGGKRRSSCHPIIAALISILSQVSLLKMSYGSIKMQKSPIACRPLADLLGQSVRFQGDLSYWETANKTDDTALLLRNVKVVPYRGDKEQIRSLDHIWIYVDKDVQASEKLERLNGYSAVGQVIGYTRSNGTKDFAIDIKPYVPIETHFELLKLHKTPSFDNLKTRTQLLEITLNLLEIEELNFRIHLSYEDVCQVFRNEYEHCHNQLELNERYQANQQRRSKPNPKIVQFASTASKSRKVAAKGFATS
jgi:hypothetical protein